MDARKSTSSSTTSSSQITQSMPPDTFGVTATTDCTSNDITRSPRLSIGKTLPLGCEHFTTTMLPPARLEEVLSDGDRKTSTKSSDPSLWWRRTRMHVALLGLAIAVVNCYAQATFCIAIVEMVYPADYVSNPGEQAPNLLTNVTLSKLASETVILQDHSCPIEFKYRDFYDASRFPDESKSPIAPNGSHHHHQQQVVDLSNRFQWDATQRGLLLGAFAFGTAPLQIVGGRLAEIYGSKWVLLAGCVGTAITNLTTPYIAHFSFLLLLINRFLMGFTQAGMEPGVMCLLADWLTPQEASLFISMSLFAICVGFFLGLLGTGLILGLGYGWPMTFYVSGGLNLALAVVWYFYADSWPHASKYIGQNELDFITSEQRKGKKFATNDLKSNISAGPLAPPPPPPLAGATNHIAVVTLEPPPPPPPDDPAKAPWLNILSTRSVWAFIICKISVRWCADVISNMMPTYLDSVLHLSINMIAIFMSISTALLMVSAFVAGWLANEIFLAEKPSETTAQQVISSKKRTRVRKAFQSIASFGTTICLVLMTLYDCDIVFSMSMLLILSFCLVMGSGGELQIPYDMTSRYPGTLHGMACTLSVSGWLAPPLIGLVLGDQPTSRFRWSIVWNSTAALTLIGGIAFVLFADSSPRDFDQKRATRKATTSKCGKGDLERGGGDEKGRNLGSQLDEGYVNGALNSSSCESSPKAVRGDTCSPHPNENIGPNSSMPMSTGVANRSEQKHNSNSPNTHDGFAPNNNNNDNNIQEPRTNSLKQDSFSNFSREFTSEGELINGSIRGGDGDNGKTIVPLVSSSALIEDYQSANGDAPRATMINDTTRGETGAKSIVCPTDGLNTMGSAMMVANEKDLSSTQAATMLVASNVERLLEGATHNAAAHRPGLDAVVGLSTRVSASQSERANQTPDSRSITHL